VSTLTLDDVREAVRSAPPGTHTSLGDDPGRKPGYDNTACLWHRSDDSWFVAWFERGSYIDQRVFAAESEACAAFLDLLGLAPPR